MPPLDAKRFSISEVSAMTAVPAHVLRQWEERFIQLNPKRDRANRRRYLQKDVDIVLRIKKLLWQEKMTSEGAKQLLDDEIRREGRPRTRQDVMRLIDEIQREVRDLIDRLGP